MKAIIVNKVVKNFYFTTKDMIYIKIYDMVNNIPVRIGLIEVQQGENVEDSIHNFLESQTIYKLRVDFGRRLIEL